MHKCSISQTNTHWTGLVTPFFLFSERLQRNGATSFKWNWIFKTKTKVENLLTVQYNLDFLLTGPSKLIHLWSRHLRCLCILQSFYSDGIAGKPSNGLIVWFSPLHTVLAVHDRLICKYYCWSGTWFSMLLYPDLLFTNGWYTAKLPLKCNSWPAVQPKNQDKYRRN